MNRFLLAILTIVAIPVAFFIYTVDTDREVSRLTPTEGAPYIKPLLEDTIYRQDIRVQQSPVTRVGLFLRRIREVPSGTSVHMEVLHNGETIHTKTLAAADIDNSAPTYIVFDPPQEIPVNDHVSVTLTVDPALSAAIGIQTRVQDETFTSEDAAWYINDEKQADPAAYETHVYVKPSLALQLSGLIMVTVIYLWLPRKELLRNSLYLFAIAHVAYLPLLYAGQHPIPQIVTALVSLFGMYTLLRFISIPVPFALFGSHIFAFTTWFALQLTGGNTIYIAASLLPWISYGILRFVKHSMMRPILVYGIPFVFVALLTLFASSPNAVASVKDVFLDPNQSPLIQKEIHPESDAQWYNFGSYVGFPVAVMSLIGIIFFLRNREGRLFIALLLVAALIVFVPVVTQLVQVTGLSPAHMSIYITYLLAISAAVGMREFTKYLGANDRLIQILMFIIVTISLLDQWHVLSTVLMRTI